MKTIFSTLLALSILLSCTAPKKEAYKVDSANASIIWTAFKTTDKVPVKGEFKSVETSNDTGNSVVDAIDGLKFEIPVSSIFTNNADRDKKISDFFFGVMVNSMTISGELNLENETTGSALIKLNGMSRKMPMSVSMEGDTVSMTGLMLLRDWKALKAVESINEACFELHKGPDGVSKTWEEVNIDLKIPVIKNN